jgi:hypothetical protein
LGFQSLEQEPWFDNDGDPQTESKYIEGSGHDIARTKREGAAFLPGVTGS